VRRPIAEASAVTATRIVMENPALGRRRIVTMLHSATTSPLQRPRLCNDLASATTSPILEGDGASVQCGCAGLHHVTRSDAMREPTVNSAYELDFDLDFDQPVEDFESATTGELELEERHALRRVAGLSTELADITEVEYRQLRLDRAVLVGVWTEGPATDADN